MSSGVCLDIFPGEPDSVPFDVTGGQFSGVDGLVHPPGIHAENLGGLADPHKFTLTFTAHTSSVYLILSG